MMPRRKKIPRPRDLPTSDYLIHLFAVLLIIGLGTFVYSHTLRYPFVFDDVPNIPGNSHIRMEHFSIKGLKDAGFDSPIKGRPLALHVVGTQLLVGGYDVVGYHVVNIAIHIANGLLVYLISLQLLRQFRKSDPRASAWIDPGTQQFVALLASLMFTVHPIQIQSVTYLIQRMNSLATMLYLAAFAFFLAGRNTTSMTKRWLLWFACAASWGLSLWSKQITITLPFVIILYEWMFFHKFTRRRPIRRDLIIIGGIIIVVSSVILIQFTAIGPVFSAYYGRDFTLGERLLTQPRVLIIYTGLTLFPLPSRFNLLHEISTSHSLFDPISTLFAIIVLFAYIAVAFIIAKLQSTGLLSPFLATDQSGRRVFVPPSGDDFRAPHVSAPDGGGAFRLPVRLLVIFKELARLRGVVAFRSSSGFSSATYVRNMVWRNPIVLWTDIIDKSPESCACLREPGSGVCGLGRLAESGGGLQSRLCSGSALRQIADRSRIFPRSRGEVP